MPITIMAVDDEPSTIHLLQILIEMNRPDWVFYSAWDGEEALEIAAHHRLDFVLLDISLPGMDGIGVCERLRAMPAMAHVPIVMLTALDTPTRREQSHAAGATAFWVKPFGPIQLIADIERLATSP
jgi:two-component system cell cycle response regulator